MQLMDINTLNLKNLSIAYENLKTQSTNKSLTFKKPYTPYSYNVNYFEYDMKNLKRV